MKEYVLSGIIAPKGYEPIHLGSLTASQFSAKIDEYAEALSPSSLTDYGVSDLINISEFDISSNRFILLCTVTITDSTVYQAGSYTAMVTRCDFSGTTVKSVLMIGDNTGNIAGCMYLNGNKLITVDSSYQDGDYDNSLYKISEDDTSVTLGTYAEWVAAGRPK